MAKRTTTAKELQSIIARLQEQRQAHLEALADIDSVFAQFGITSQKKKRRGRPRKSKKKVARRVAKRRKRRTKRKVSGPQSILNFVKRVGKKGVSGAEIVNRWNAEGRAGDAYAPIGKLVKAKKLKRDALKGQRGSRYTAA